MRAETGRWGEACEEEARFQMKYVGLDPEYLKNIQENCPADSGSA